MSSRTRPLSRPPMQLPWNHRLKIRVVQLWKTIGDGVAERNKSLRTSLVAIPPQYVTYAAGPFILGVTLASIYSLALLYRNPSVKSIIKVLSWVGGEMMWLILSWGLVAILCYFALNHLGTNNVEGANKNGVSGTTASTSGNTSNHEWTNEVLAWMYNNFHKVPGPLDAWIKSLNDAAKKVTSPTKCEVLFEGFGDHSNVQRPPKITDIRVEKGPRDHLTLRTHVHLPCVRLKLVSSQRTPERLIVSNLDASIIDLRGEIECRIACIANQLYLMGCFNGRPEMDIEIHNSDPNAQQSVSFGLVEESIRRCLLSAVTNINLSETIPSSDEFWRSDGPAVMETFNRAMNQPQMTSSYSGSYDYSEPTPTHNIQNVGLTVNNGTLYSDSQNSHYIRSGSPTNVPEMFKKLNDQHLISPTMNSSTVPNKLRVKIIRASRLGRGSPQQDVQQPYVVIEMDEPAQRFSSSKGINAGAYWDETFSFDLTPASEEILFEVYEGSNRYPADDERNFLGLSIVNFEEIRRSGELVLQQIHALKLQGRPYRKDEVGGDLTVQFDFYYDPSSITAGKLIDSVRVKDQNGTEFRETVTTQRRPIYDPHDNFDVNDVTPTKTTTVVVKTVSHQLKEKPAIQSVHGSMENAVDPATQRVLDQQFRHPGDEKMRQLEAQLQRAAEGAQEGGHRAYFVVEKDPVTKDSAFVNSTFEDDRRGRDRTKKNGSAPGEKRERSFFGELRDRLSGRRKSQKRSKSVDPSRPEIEEAVSLPPSRDASRTRYAVSDSGNRYLETQSVGARSGESSRSLYQHSTLVLEMEHDKQNKYFLIPPTMLTEPAAAKIMKKGKKLHIYNEHTFVAVKIGGGANCNVCTRRISGSSFTKQAYQCRDCKLVCHKSCHYKTDAFCTQSTVSKLQIAKDIDWAHFFSHNQHEEFISFAGV